MHSPSHTQMEDNAQCKKPINHQSIAIRGQRIKMAAEVSMIRSSGVKRRWSRALCQSLVGDKSTKEEAAVTDGTEGDEDAEIERRITTLKRLVPGGEEMEMDTLFEETADYIEVLRGQVNLMRALAQTIDGVARERRKMGGNSL